MRLIDAEELIPMLRYATIESEIGVFPIRIGFNDIKKVVDDAPTVDAIPISFIDELIELSRKVGADHHAESLEILLQDWAERKEK